MFEKKKEMKMLGGGLLFQNETRSLKVGLRVIEMVEVGLCHYVVCLDV